jgi:lipooligosaccharide transport system permease protein
MTSLDVRTTPSPWPVFYHRWVVYLRTWRGTVFSSFLIPVMFLVGIGISVGSYVDNNSTLGYPYVDYIAPGLLVAGVLQVAVNEATYPVFAGFQWVRTYHAMSSSPLRQNDMVAGELLYGAFRGITSAAGFLVVMALFGTLHSWLAPATLAVSLLLGVAVATPALAYSASIRTENSFAVLNRFAIIPMTLFAGVFFPIENLPLVARVLAYVSPLWHAVELSRASTLGTATAWPWVWHVGYLGVWAVGGFLLARRRYTRRLSD